MKGKGARLHPMSGAGTVKFDGSDDDYIFEVKNTRRSFSLSGQLLANMFRLASRQGKQPKLLIRFSDFDLVAEVTITPGIDGWNGKRNP